MKKVMLSLGVVAAAALSLVSCQKEISNPDENPAVKGTPFEIIATSADTKTVNKDLATEWAGGESINLFYAAAGETTYNNGGEFNTTDAGASVKFNGTLDASKLGDSNDWYAFYPYSDYITTPANTSNGYSVVGSKFNTAQTQDGIDSKAHLANESCPMYAITRGIAKETTPELAFHHLSSVIKVRVTNSTAEALTVSSVSFTAPEDIVGTYFIDFSSETPSYTASDAEKKYVSSTATLNVTSAEIATGAAADFYLAIKPFTAKAGSTLKLAVNGNEKAIELTKDVTFTAGNIKPLKFDYNIVAEDYSGTYLLLNGDKTKVCPAFASGNNISAVDYTSEKIDDSWVMTIKKISGSTMYTIQDANGMYLSTGATKDKNYMVGLNDADKSRSSWTISLGADGNYSIVATNSSYRNILRYNPTNDLFACYSSGQNPVTLVKYTLLPSLEKPEVVASANPANNGIDVIWSDVENAMEYVVTCTGQTDQIINPGVMATSFSGLTDGDYVVTVTATAEGYKPATATAESIHIGLASRNLKFTDNSKTLGFNEEYTNTLSGETSGVKFSIINAEGNAPSESEIGYFDTETGELLTGTVAGTYTITATAPATTEYAAGTASYTLIVKDGTTGGVEVGTILWEETWTGGTANDTPAKYSQTGTTVYGDYSVTYSSSYSNTKLYNDQIIYTDSENNLNLLLYGNKSGKDTWTISGIPTGNTKKLTFTFDTNNKTTTRYKLSTKTNGITISDTSVSGTSTPFTVTATISITEIVETFDLSISNTTTSNVRLDNLKIVVTE